MSELPIDLKKMIEEQASLLINNPSYDLHPFLRTEIYAAIGPSNVQGKEDSRIQFERNINPIYTAADRVRIRAAILAAQKVNTLWAQAEKEAERNFGEMYDEERSFDEETKYLLSHFANKLESINAFTVPDLFRVQHILEMAELALRSKIDSIEQFKEEVNEWWGLYPVPMRQPRAYSIKWAATEALYLSVHWQVHMYMRVKNYDYPINNTFAKILNYSIILGGRLKSKKNVPF